MTNQAKYFVVLVVALMTGLWINIMHHTQISREWVNANTKFAEMEMQLDHLESLCAKR